MTLHLLSMLLVHDLDDLRYLARVRLVHVWSFVFVASLAICSDTDPGSLVLAAHDVIGRPGESVTIPVSVRDAASVGALQVDLTFDPYLLEPLDVREGPLVKNGAVVASEVDHGRLRIKLIRCDPIEGCGTILLPRFTVHHRDHRTTGIGLEEVCAWNAARTLKLRTVVEPGRFSLKAGSEGLGAQSGGIRISAVVGLCIAGCLVLVLWLSVPARKPTNAGSRARARIRSRLARLVNEA